MENDIRTNIKNGVYNSQEPYPSGLSGLERMEALNAYHTSQRLGLTLFKADALEEVGLTNHPKADKAYELAWSRGHSSGFAEVLFELEELADLLK